MKTSPIPAIADPTTRRHFLRTSATLATAAAVGPLALARAVHTAGSDVIRVGLIGCGGRGTDAALNALNASQDIRLVALADLFDGDLFDHQSCVFEYESGVRVFALTRSQSECYPDTSDTFFGTRGRCDLLRYQIQGKRAGVHGSLVCIGSAGFLSWI